jgi:hypothetical protein
VIAHGGRVLDVVRLTEQMWCVVHELASGKLDYDLVEAYDTKVEDEQDTQRNLGYEFSMPSPLRRMLGDLVTAVQSIAMTFDPNNTNNELSRILLTIALGEGLEVQDAPELVDQALPKGYVDPALAAQMAGAGLGPDGKPLPGQAPPTAGFGPADAGKAFPSGADGNPYSAPMNARMPEQMPKTGPYANQQAEYLGRDGEPRQVAPRRLALTEAGVANMGELERARLEGRQRTLDDDFQEDVYGPAMAALDQADLLAGG